VKAATEAMIVVRENGNIFGEATISAGTAPSFIWFPPYPMVLSSHNTTSWGRP
jgi:hypothetical protein